MTLQDELWINIGHSATAETFDKLLGRVVEQNGNKTAALEVMARGISDYPASFAPVLTKHGISFKDTLDIDRDVKTPLWQYVAISSEPDFAKAFFEKLDKKRPLGLSA